MAKTKMKRVKPHSLIAREEK